MDLVVNDWHDESEPIDWLRAEYRRRKAANGSYSLRAFARQLKINSGRLSDYLSKKRPISRNMGIGSPPNSDIHPKCETGFWRY